MNATCSIGVNVFLNTQCRITYFCVGVVEYTAGLISCSFSLQDLLIDIPAGMLISFPSWTSKRWATSDWLPETSGKKSFSIWPKQRKKFKTSNFQLVLHGMRGLTEGRKQIWHQNRFLMGTGPLRSELNYTCYRVLMLITTPMTEERPDDILGLLLAESPANM